MFVVYAAYLSLCLCGVKWSLITSRAELNTLIMKNDFREHQLEQCIRMYTAANIFAVWHLLACLRLFIALAPSAAHDDMCTCTRCLKMVPLACGAPQVEGFGVKLIMKKAASVKRMNGPRSPFTSAFRHDAQPNDFYGYL